MIGDPVNLDHEMEAAAIAASALGVLGGYIGYRAGGGFGAFWGAVAGIFVGLTWGSMKWSYNQREGINIMLRQKMPREDFVWRGAKNGWRTGPRAILGLIFLSLALKGYI